MKMSKIVDERGESGPKQGNNKCLTGGRRKEFMKMSWDEDYWVQKVHAEFEFGSGQEIHGLLAEI